MSALLDQQVIRTAAANNSRTRTQQLVTANTAVSLSWEPRATPEYWSVVKIEFLVAKETLELQSNKLSKDQEQIGIL